ncbi:unnamed protein product [Ranitomeya imitator]|uniref:Uncharacterized protein n=1 Tax=Ranitomeya imitator TaxID=111125 RepID=A0ABN9MFD5_9NEOB|nr:unnamed protein product [Ranitomeya imitator]
MGDTTITICHKRGNGKYKGCFPETGITRYTSSAGRTYSPVPDITSRPCSSLGLWEEDSAQRTSLVSDLLAQSGVLQSTPTLHVQTPPAMKLKDL